jgi:hypothetical protein
MLTQVVQIHRSAHPQVLADTIMGFADGTKMVTGFPGTRKNPVTVGKLLSALFQEIKHFLGTSREYVWHSLFFHAQSGWCGSRSPYSDTSSERVHLAACPHRA